MVISTSDGELLATATSRSQAAVSRAYGDDMRNVMRVSVVLATVVGVIVAAYSLLIIGIDLFGEKTAMSGMGFAVGGAGLLVALLVVLAATLGRRYLKEHPGNARDN